MAHPHPTPEVPAPWPHLGVELVRVAHDNDHRHVLRQVLEGGRPEPTFVPGHVCATAWVLSSDASHVLLVRHRIFGWSSPGGHIEPHETTRDGALRELEEETGLTRFDVRAVFDHPALVHVSDLPGDRPHRHWNVAWLYVASMDAPLIPDEGARWWSTAALPNGSVDLGETTEVLRGLLLEGRARPILSSDP